jgi:hypothetical protein
MAAFFNQAMRNKGAAAVLAAARRPEVDGYSCTPQAARNIPRQIKTLRRGGRCFAGLDQVDGKGAVPKVEIGVDRKAARVVRQP